MNTNPNNYRTTGSVNEIGKYLHTIVTLHYPNGKTKQISKTTKLFANNKNGTRCSANWKEAERLLQIRKTDAIAQAVSKALSSPDHGNTAKRNPIDILFIDACEAWVANYKGAETTQDAYALTCKAHLRPYFEPLGLHLSEISEDILQEYVDFKTNPNSQKPLKGKTVKKHMAVISNTLKERKNKKVSQNICFADLEYPEDEDFEPTVYTEEELQKLLNACTTSPIRDAIILAAMYGLRRSEFLGLKWSLVDLDRKTMRIRDAEVYVTKTFSKRTPKNSSSDRTLALDDKTVKYLKQLKETQEKNKQYYGDTYYDNDYVCKYPDGKPFNIRYFNELFTKLLEKNGLRKIRLHDLRHTFATQLIDRGENVTVVQEALGHSSSVTTLDTYAHSFKARETAAITKHCSVYSF